MKGVHALRKKNSLEKKKKRQDSTPLMNTYCEWLLVFIALFVPPVSILIKYPPLCLQKLIFRNTKKKSQYIHVENEFLTSCALFFLGYLPALIHSLYLISKNDDHYKYYNELNRRHKSNFKNRPKRSTSTSELLRKTNKLSRKHSSSRVKKQHNAYGSV